MASLKMLCGAEDGVMLLYGDHTVFPMMELPTAA
jgi:hypothetical protein